METPSITGIIICKDSKADGKRGNISWTVPREKNTYTHKLYYKEREYYNLRILPLRNCSVKVSVKVEASGQLPGKTVEADLHPSRIKTCSHIIGRTTRSTKAIASLIDTVSKLLTLNEDCVYVSMICDSACTL